MTKTSRLEHLLIFYIVDMANNMDSGQTAPWEQSGQGKFIVFTSMIRSSLQCT